MVSMPIDRCTVPSTTSGAPQALASVPPFPRLKARLNWVYKLRGREPCSDLLPIRTTSEAAERTHCLLCDVEIAANKKTKDRHLGSSQHLMHVAQELQVDLSTLQLPPVPCAFCGKRFNASRKDALKRHETKFCRSNATRINSVPMITPQLSLSRRSSQDDTSQTSDMPSSLKPISPISPGCPPSQSWTLPKLFEQEFSNCNPISSREVDHGSFFNCPSTSRFTGADLGGISMPSDTILPSPASYNASGPDPHELDSALFDPNASWFDDWIDLTELPS